MLRLLIVLLIVLLVSVTYGQWDEESLQALKSLPYAHSAPVAEKDVDKNGVCRYVNGKVFDGVNLWCPRNTLGAHVIDMAGRPVHVFKDKRAVTHALAWHHVEPVDKTNLLVVVENKTLLKIDWNSNILWQKRMRVHHDVCVGVDGMIYALSMQKKVAPLFSEEEPITDNTLVVLSADGVEQAVYSFADIIAKYPELLALATNTTGKMQLHVYDKDAWDIFHANTVDVIDRDIFHMVDGEKQLLFGKGDILFCIRNMNMIGVLNLETQSLRWKWGMDDLEFPHEPSLLTNGNILVFDNGTKRKYSRVVEVDPRTNEMVWEYKADPVRDFFSPMMGCAQRLPNGNTLITESAVGHVIEVTRKGELVWEYFTPLKPVEEIKNPRKTRVALYRMLRFPDSPHGLSGLSEMNIR